MIASAIRSAMIAYSIEVTPLCFAPVRTAPDVFFSLIIKL
jgi:hypothetical protein